MDLTRPVGAWSWDLHGTDANPMSDLLAHPFPICYCARCEGYPGVCVHVCAQVHVCEHVCVCACVQAGVSTGMGAGVCTDVCACVPRFMNCSQRMCRQGGFSLALDPSMALRPVCAHLPEPDSSSPWPQLLRTEHQDQLPAITGMFTCVPSGKKTKTKTGTVCQHD